MTKTQFTEYLDRNHPHLAALTIPDLKKVGFYRKDAGAATSFRGFGNWQEAYEVLVND